MKQPPIPYLGDSFKARQMPPGKIRCTKPQRPITDLPLFAGPVREGQKDLFKR